MYDTCSPQLFSPWFKGLPTLLSAFTPLTSRNTFKHLVWSTMVPLQGLSSVNFDILPMALFTTFCQPVVSYEQNMAGQKPKCNNLYFLFPFICTEHDIWPLVLIFFSFLAFCASEMLVVVMCFLQLTSLEQAAVECS